MLNNRKRNTSHKQLAMPNQSKQRKVNISNTINVVKKVLRL